MSATANDPDLVDRLLLQLTLWQDELAGHPAAERIEELVQLATRAAAGQPNSDPALLWEAVEDRLRAGETPPEFSAPREAPSPPRSVRGLSPQDHADGLVAGWATLTPLEQRSVQESLLACGVVKPAAPSLPAVPSSRESTATELADRLGLLVPAMAPSERDGILRRLGLPSQPPTVSAPTAGSAAAVELEGLDGNCFESVPAAARRLSASVASRLLCLLLNRVSQLYVEASCTWEEGYKGEQKYATHRRKDDQWLARALERAALKGDIEGFHRELDARLALVVTEIRNFRFVDRLDGSEPGVDCASLREMVQQLWPEDILKAAPRAFAFMGPNKEVAWDIFEARFKQQVGAKRDHRKLLDRLRVDVARRLAVDLINHESEAWEDPGGGS